MSHKFSSSDYFEEISLFGLLPDHDPMSRDEDHFNPEPEEDKVEEVNPPKVEQKEDEALFFDDESDRKSKEENSPTDSVPNRRTRSKKYKCPTKNFFPTFMRCHKNFITTHFKGLWEKIR